MLPWLHMEKCFPHDGVAMWLGERSINGYRRTACFIWDEEDTFFGHHHAFSLRSNCVTHGRFSVHSLLDSATAVI